MAMTAESPYALEVKGLSTVLGGQKVLEIPSLQIYPNEVLVVMGPNGSGKTTLILSLALLLKPATGTIYYQGIPVLDSKNIVQIRRKVAMLFQEPLLLNSTVWDNVTLGLRLRGVKGDEIKARTQKWLERFGIAPLARRQAKTLSGGEARRVSLARAFVLQPEILFLDEPFNALDSPTRQSLLEDFESVLRETKVTTVMVTHERNEALILGKRVAIIMNGSIRQMGSPEEVFSTPVDEEVAGFVEAGNILHGVVESHSEGIASVKIGKQHISVVSDFMPGTRVTMYLHYNDVTIFLPSSQNAPSSARNRLVGNIVKITPFGPQVRVTIDCGFPLQVLLTKKSAEELGLVTGREVHASFKATAIRTIKRHD